MTCLLYLTTNDEGATTFPSLANRMDTVQLFRREPKVLNAAQSLLNSGVTHTFDKVGALMLYKQEDDNGEASSLGLRVLPRAGMLCVFGCLLEGGTDDPHSFHSGESGNDEEKALFTFFQGDSCRNVFSASRAGSRATKTRESWSNNTSTVSTSCFQ